MRGRSLMNLVSKARLATQCRGSASEMNLGNAARFSSGAATGSSPSPLMGNQRLSSYLMRLPREVACSQSLLPLYSVTASARLVSQLSTNAGLALADLHGTLTHMSPDR